MNVTKHFAATSFVLALIATTSAFAAPPSATLPSVGTLTIPTPFGSSPVVAWSWGASNSGSLVVGGHPNIQDLSLTRYTDGQSPLFFKYVAEGTHLPAAVLVDGSTTIALADVLVSSYSTAIGSSTGNSAQTQPRTENITFEFAQITYTVNGVTTCFNVKTQKSC